MKVELKQLINTRWHPIEISNLVGMSICQFMMTTDKIVVAALMNDDKKKIAIVSNAQHILDMFSKENLFLILAKDLNELLGQQPIGELIVTTFPDASLISVEYKGEA